MGARKSTWGLCEGRGQLPASVSQSQSGHRNEEEADKKSASLLRAWSYHVRGSGRAGGACQQLQFF